MGIQVADVKLIDNSLKIKEASKSAIAKALAEIGGECETYAKKDCPVDTGNLRNSIAFQVEMSENAVYVGARTNYAAYVELGTVKMKARPYIRPAAENHTSQYKAIVEKHLKNG